MCVNCQTHQHIFLFCFAIGKVQYSLHNIIAEHAQIVQNKWRGVIKTFKFHQGYHVMFSNATPPGGKLSQELFIPLS